jgi:hypothetical protein
MFPTYKMLKYPCTNQIQACLDDVACWARFMMFSACAYAPENKDVKCKEIDIQNVQTVGWGEEFK